MKSFFQRWLITTAAVLVAAMMIPGIHYDRPVSLFAASLVLGILNALLRPLLVVLALPLLVLTLGLFFFVINALLLYWVGMLVKGFHVNSFWSAFWGGLVISVVSLVLNSLTGTGNSRMTVRRGRPPTRRGGHDEDGPIIDV